MSDKIIFKSKKKYTVTKVLATFAILFLSPLCFYSKIWHNPIGPVWLTLGLIILLFSLLKISQVTITPTSIYKTNFFIKRKVRFENIKRYTLKHSNITDDPYGQNILAVLKYYKGGDSFKKATYLRLYIKGSIWMLIDSRSMPKKDFQKIVTLTKKGIVNARKNKTL